MRWLNWFINDRRLEKAQRERDAAHRRTPRIEQRAREAKTDLEQNQLAERFHRAFGWVEGP